jgi:hypothetical protein
MSKDGLPYDFTLEKIDIVHFNSFTVAQSVPVPDIVLLLGMDGAAD